MRRLVALALVLPLLTSACGAAGGAAPYAPVQVIDEREGSYRGVRLGTTPSEVTSIFGERKPAGENEPGTPLAMADGTDGPWVIPYPDGPCPAPVYRFEHVAFGFNCDELLWMEIVEPGAQTERGVAVGDPLALVAEAYSEARCGTAGGGEYEEYPACAMKLGKRLWVWFGGDPITTITLGSVPLDGVTVDKPFTGRTLTLDDGEFVTYPAGEVKPGDKIVCQIDGKEIEVFVPRPDTGVSVDPVYVATHSDGRVTAECGGIHAETAPPGSW